MSEFHRATFNRRIEARIPFSSLLVVESVGEQGLTNNGDLAMKQALREVVSVLKNERTDQASLLEILTGVRTQVEAFAAELAHQESLSLCLLSVGKPCSLTESQKLAQRQRTNLRSGEK